MDLRGTETERSFRTELRDWLSQAIPTVPPEPSPEDWAGRRAFDTAWQRLLHDAGYAGLTWPAEFGGRGSSPTEHLIFLEETERAGAPYVGVNFVGLLHAGPTLIAEGTPSQRADHLLPILRGEEVWCQGFSEPGAGSDLASLQTKAARHGDDYVVSGQKIWTSFAHVADVCELLVRTDPAAPKHRGITWLIMPMSSPGIEVRPMRTIAGSREFCEVFLDEVRVPVSNRVGEENDGWRVAMSTLTHERVGTVTYGIQLRQKLEALLGREEAWPEDPVGRRLLGQAVADLWTRVEIIRLTALRAVTKAARDETPWPEVSIGKLLWSTVSQDLASTAIRVLGPDGLRWPGDPEAPDGGRWAFDEVQSRMTTIGAGTTEVQKNILAERALGMPRG